MERWYALFPNCPSNWELLAFSYTICRHSYLITLHHHLLSCKRARARALSWAHAFNARDKQLLKNHRYPSSLLVLFFLKKFTHPYNVKKTLTKKIVIEKILMQNYWLFSLKESFLPLPPQTIHFSPSQLPLYYSIWPKTWWKMNKKEESPVIIITDIIIPKINYYTL